MAGRRGRKRDASCCGGERDALHLVDRSGVDEELGPQQLGQLAEVHLGDQHLRVATQHVAEVGGERVEVGEVGLDDLASAGPHPVHATADGAPGGPPADDEDLGVVDVAAQVRGRDVVGDPRDRQKVARLEAYSDQHGIWDCTRCYFCNERCPKGVDPRDANVLRVAISSGGVWRSESRLRQELPPQPILAKPCTQEQVRAVLRQVRANRKQAA